MQQPSTSNNPVITFILVVVVLALCGWSAYAGMQLNSYQLKETRQHNRELKAKNTALSKQNNGLQNSLNVLNKKVDNLKLCIDKSGL